MFRACWHTGRLRHKFVIARNPEPDSKLPYLLWVPLGQRGLVFKAGRHLAAHQRGVLPPH